MKELPVIGSLCLRKEFWDRHGENIVTRYKGTYGERFFWSPKKRFLQDYGFFAAVLLYMDRDMLIRGKCKFFVGITTKYVIKKTEKLLSLRKVYFEIVIA